jgi:hypothetical protein
MRAAAASLLAALAVASCTQEPPAPRPVETEVPEDMRGPKLVRSVENFAGTPMAERVAVIGVLNKRNNLSQNFEMKPGEARRWGDVIVRLSACERTAPWEFPRQTGAFTQVFVRGARDNDGWRKVFSGWQFKESPSLNVVEHPIYDVWVKDCRMSFSGDSPEAQASASSAPNAAGSETAPSAPAAEPAPEAPAASPSPTASASNAT